VLSKVVKIIAQKLGWSASSRRRMSVFEFLVVLVSEFGLSGKYFITHARRPQSHFHFSCRVPGLAGHLPMPSVDTLSPLIGVSSSCIYKDSFLASHLL
jgi:hypothetical protein